MHVVQKMKTKLKQGELLPKKAKLTIKGNVLTHRPILHKKMRILISRSVYKPESRIHAFLHCMVGVPRLYKRKERKKKIKQLPRKGLARSGT